MCPRRAQGFQLEALFSKQPFYLLTCICRRSLNLRTWLAPISWRRRNPKRYAVLLCSITLPQANLSLLPSSLPPSSLCSLPLILKIARQILEAHASMLTLSMHDAKLQYIRNWQALQDFGITYFLLKVGRSRKEVSKNSVSNLIPIPEFHPYYTHTHHAVLSISFPWYLSYRFHWEYLKIHFSNYKKFLWLVHNGASSHAVSRLTVQHVQCSCHRYQQANLHIYLIVNTKKVWASGGCFQLVVLNPPPSQAVLDLACLWWEASSCGDGNFEVSLTICQLLHKHWVLAPVLATLFW